MKKSSSVLGCPEGSRGMCEEVLQVILSCRSSCWTPFEYCFQPDSVHFNDGMIYCRRYLAVLISFICSFSIFYIYNDLDCSHPRVIRTVILFWTLNHDEQSTSC